MVSFSCEACGDILTKKKLDAHRGQCRGASYTCIDCMTHFRGTDYRSHTSCISEAQKYQGALYKEKPSKQLKKSVKISESSALAPRKAYVEDAPDPDTGSANALAIVDAPPEAPSPPPAVPSQPSEPVNVFDFLVNGEDTPNASKVSLGGTRKPMSMVADAPSVFEAGRQLVGELEGEHEYDSAYEEHGYSYGTDPVPAEPQPKQIEYQTPAPKGMHNDSREAIYELDARDRPSTDKKRKRQHVEDLDIAAIRRSQERDEVMVEAPPILHSGLTGGLNRLLSKSKFLPSPEYSGNEPGTLSPPKRNKTIIAKERGRNGQKALVKIRKGGSSSRRTSDESRPRKHHRSHHHSTTATNGADDHSERLPKRKMRTIEYHPDPRNDSQQLVVYRTRAEMFMSFVNKGPESETGCSINKALKRYHREREEQGLGLGKADEEKELWKSLRLKRNEKGEVVLFI